MTSDPALVERLRSEVLRIFGGIPVGVKVPVRPTSAQEVFFKVLLRELLYALDKVTYAASRDPLNMSHFHLSWDDVTHTVYLRPTLSAPGWLKELWTEAFNEHEKETDNG